MTILETIDHAIEDWETSPDAMRWTPEPPPAHPWLAYDTTPRFDSTTPVIDPERLTATVTMVQGTFGPAVADFAEHAGLVLTAWQRDVVDRLFGEVPMSFGFDLSPLEAARREMDALAAPLRTSFARGRLGAWISAAIWDECVWPPRRPARVTRMRSAYHARKGKRW
ncbi:MAG TPA: hypothetical protein VIQ30_10595 [Pseudonocardia sp.]